MEEIKYFFRTTNDGLSFINFSGLHLFFIILILVAFILFAKKIKNIYKWKKIIGTFFLFYNVIFYSWYFITGYTGMKESLPLYFCRISIILYTINFLFDKKFFYKELLYIGFFGPISAFFYPTLDMFKFPHFTYFTFFIGHLFLLFATILVLKENSKIISIKNCLRAMIFALVVNIISYFVNIKYDGNYNCINQSPLFPQLFANYPSYVYSITASILILIIIFIAHLILKIVKRFLI